MQPMQNIPHIFTMPTDAGGAVSVSPRSADGHGTVPGNAAPFSGVFNDAMGNLEGLEQQATTAVQGLVSGQGVDVHQAMIATEKSDLAFETALAVRGKLVSAYQTMMGIQF